IWSGDQGYESSRPSSVTLVLQKREEFSNQGWSEVDRKTITSDNWSELAEWSDLPAKNTENGHAIYYRVAEPDQISGYVTDFDEDGSNTDAQLDVTNVYDSLILKGHKEWIGDSAFKSDRPATVTFKLQRKTDSQTSWSDVADTEKTLTKNSNNEFDDVSWEPQPKRDPEGELYTYRIIEDPVPQGYVSQSSETRSSGWLTVTNTSTKIKIVVSKRWLNDSAVSAQRPSLDILLQSKEGEDGQWTTVEKKKLNVSANTTSTVEFNGLPTMSENGEPYYYRAVEETVPDGYKESYAVKINDNERSEINQEKGVYLTKDTNLEITNDYSLAYTKTAVDEKGKPITQESIKGMKTHMLDVNKSGSTDEVYVIKYSVDFTQATGFEDRLPANFRFLNIEGYKPKYYYSNDPKNATDMYELATQANIDGATFRAYYYDSVANNLYLQTEGAGRIEYYVYILKEDMPEITSAGYNIINRITSRNEGSETVTSTLKITDEKDYLTKQVQLGDRQQSGRMFSYILDVNPEGRFITNDGTIVITDLFNITGVGYQSGAITKGRGLVDAAFSNLQVYDVDKGETLQLGDYTYTIDYGSNIATEVDITSDYEMETTEASDNPGRYTYSVVGNFKSGDTIVMKMYGSPNQYHYGAFKLDWTEAATIPSQLDENGELEIRYTFTSDFSGTVKLEGYQTTGAELVSVTTKEYPDEADGTLSISVPDGRHIRITYDYELTCNDNTPLRYNNQNVSGVTMAVADPNGTEKVKLGDNLPAGSVVTAENSASLQSNKGEETSDSGEQELVAQYTQAENASGGVPKIEKVNIGNYAISTLKATFRIAKYDRVNGWVYATGFSEGTDQTPGEIEFDRVLTESNGYMPEDAAKIVIDGRTKTYLENGTLYKFVEIVAPEGYKPTGWTDEAPLSLDELDEFTFYFINNVTSTTAMPAGFDPETANYVSGGKALDIPNIEMIDIKVSKNWETPEDLNGQTSTSKVELLWSDKKSATIPANAKRATPEDLDIDDPDFISTFENVKTLSASTGDATTVWTDLPNGVKGKPIYYYVREISYTIGSTEFKLRDDGSFTTDPDEHGDVIVGTYRPLYVGNGANRSGSEVDITNGRDLVIRKFWKDTGNNDVDGQDVEFKEVGFMLYGIDVQGRKSDDPIFSGKLKRSENWEYDLSGVDLGDYVDFEVVEVVDDPAFDLDLTKAQTRTLRKMYSVSYIKNLNGDIGELTIINKDSTPTKIPYEVKKVWHDGKTEHDPVTVHLYKTKLDLSEYPGWDGSIDPDFVTAVNAAEGDDTIIEVGQQTLSDANEWQYIWKNMDYIYDTDNSLHWFYYVYEDPIDSEKYPGYETEVDYEGDKDGVYATVINSQPEKITIKKVWENTDNYTVPEFVEFELYRTTSQYNVVPDGVPADLDEQKGTESYWKYQYVKNIKLRKSEDWTLEIANVPAVDSSNNKYYYFVREVDTNKMFSISYDGNSATLENSDTITVTNAVKTVDLDLRKQWTDGGEHLNDPITVKVYRTKQSNDNNGQLQAITATPQVLVVKPAANDVITTNCTNIKAVSSDPTVAEVTANSDGTVTVTAKALGETTVTITDNESLSQTTVTVIVSEKAVPVLSIDKKEINAGESAQLTVESVGGELQGEITYSVRVLEGNPNVTVDQATGQVTATNMGKVEITATADGIVSKPVTLTVGLADFTVDAEMEVSTEVSKQIKPDPSYGTFKYTSTDPTKVVVDENTGMVSGVRYTTT
ncbi:MAG: Cna B-type domain-containing protein, partial [Ruminococcus sp.]|nr:Cna B-type domain-containing protein [Ruminococcus sp.]